MVFQESHIVVGDARCSPLQVVSGGLGAEPTTWGAIVRLLSGGRQRRGRPSLAGKEDES